MPAAEAWAARDARTDEVQPRKRGQLAERVRDRARHLRVVEGQDHQRAEPAELWRNRPGEPRVPEAQVRQRGHVTVARRDRPDHSGGGLTIVEGQPRQVHQRDQGRNRAGRLSDDSQPRRAIATIPLVKNMAMNFLVSSTYYRDIL